MMCPRAPVTHTNVTFHPSSNESCLKHPERAGMSCQLWARMPTPRAGAGGLLCFFSRDSAIPTLRPLAFVMYHQDRNVLTVARVYISPQSSPWLPCQLSSLTPHPHVALYTPFLYPIFQWPQLPPLCWGSQGQAE